MDTERIKKLIAALVETQSKKARGRYAAVLLELLRPVLEDKDATDN